MMNNNGNGSCFFVCGASGLVGRQVVAGLCNEGFKVYAATSRPGEWKDSRKGLHVIANEEIEDVFKEKKVDAMLHLAFPRNVSQDQWANGIQFASDVLFMAQKYDIPKVVHVSSQSIYGLQRTKPADEQTTFNLTSPYTTGKFCMELLVNHLFFDRPCTNIRLSTTIGPNTKERVPNKIIQRIVQGDDIVIKGGMQKFSFLDVRDAASGLITILKSNGSGWKSAYNLGTEESHPLLEIADTALDIGRRYGYCKSSLIHEPDEVIMNNSLNVQRFYDDFGWRAEYSLEQSLEHIFAEYYGACKI